MKLRHQDLILLVSFSAIEGHLKGVFGRTGGNTSGANQHETA